MASEGAAATRRFYDRLSSVYDLLTRSEEPLQREFLEFSEIKPGESAVEIGCGTGKLLAQIAQKVAPNGSVLGIDLSSKMLARARERTRGFGHVQLIESAVPPLPAPDHSMDLVLASFTLEILPAEDLTKILIESRRVLRNSGRLAVLSMAKPRLPEETTRMFRLYQWSHRKFPHWVDCRPIEWTEVFANSPFQIVREKRINLFGLPVTMLVAQ
jgi:ubiquinone/menaquinone biosynthesis C-methylase UbiE